MTFDPRKHNPLKNPALAGASKAATRQATTLVDEFKAFAFKGNVVDLAVGVVIGAAFAKIVDSLVKHIIMPLIGVVLPGQKGYLGWKWVINEKEVPYGLFLGELVNFLIVAAALFVFVVKFLGWVMRARKSKRKTASAAPPTREQELLAEIRDLLRAQQKP